MKRFLILFIIAMNFACSNVSQNNVKNEFLNSNTDFQCLKIKKFLIWYKMKYDFLSENLYINLPDTNELKVPKLNMNKLNLNIKIIEKENLFSKRWLKEYKKKYLKLSEILIKQKYYDEEFESKYLDNGDDFFDTQDAYSYFDRIDSVKYLFKGELNNNYFILTQFFDKDFKIFKIVRENYDWRIDNIYNYISLPWTS